ncbi:NAD(P)/FAD-dependent oxidoreductase [Plantactinospora sp. B6F1]|uniref:FAD-dependent monooxygenase n=1 Tax=Plantactinospora sp. B6F1 TaxID=3158971 RepID=UPI00102AFF33
MPQRLRVLVAGGGIGGLCLAQGLRRAGVEVTVFERAPSADAFREGYRIHLDPDGSRALHSCLPSDRYALLRAACGRPPRSFAFLTEGLGELLAVDVAAPDPAADPIATHLSINRFTLRQVMLDGLGDVVQFGKEFTRYERRDDTTVTAHFADGTQATGSVLVGAEGTSSRVRAQLLPHANRVDTGVVTVAGRIALEPDARALLPDHLGTGPAMILAPGGINMFLATHEHDPARAGVPAHLLPPDREDYLVWAIGARPHAFPTGSRLESLDGQALHRLALSVTRTWDSRVAELVRRTDPTTVNFLRIHTSVPVEAWPASTVTLLGDAIHSMPPSRGIGANTALRDASLLCSKLVEADRRGVHPADAIGDYERQMREYGFAAAKASVRALEQSVTENRFAFFASKTSLRLINALPAVKNRIFA